MKLKKYSVKTLTYVTGKNTYILLFKKFPLPDLNTTRTQLKYYYILEHALSKYLSNDMEHTFVVHVGRYLHHAEAEVNRQVVEMFVGLQDELST